VVEVLEVLEVLEVVDGGGCSLFGDAEHALRPSIPPPSTIARVSFAGPELITQIDRLSRKDEQDQVVEPVVRGRRVDGVDVASDAVGISPVSVHAVVRLDIEHVG
jgi:hypothetical protein